MEEENLFKEITPLIEEYKAYSKQEMPDSWNDTRGSALPKEDKVYGNDREGEILKTLDEGKIYDKKLDDIIPIPVSIRRELIEELTRNKRV